MSVRKRVKLSYLSSQKLSHGGSWLSTIVSVLILLSVGWLGFNYQYVVDQVAVWSYHSDPQLDRIINDTKLTTRGEFYLKASNAQIANADTFSKQCKKTENHSAILGCYVNNRIYVYDITDERLDGIKEVTTVHEMLHAAWDRLGSQRQQELTKLLEAEYQKLKTAELEERMAYYYRNEPTEIANELHSILPTEISELSPELESYYSGYTDDRAGIVSLYDKYSAVFDSIQDEADTLSAQASALASSIDTNTKSYNADMASLNSEIQNFNSRASSGYFSTPSHFNTARAGLVSRTDSLESRRKALQADIDKYNSMVQRLNELSTKSNELQSSIDSTLAAPPSL